MKTLHLKIRNPKNGFLEDCAREVNQAWNYANQVSTKAIRSFAGKPKYLSAFDLNNLTSGCTFHSERNPEGFRFINLVVVQSVNQEYTTRRTQFKKSKLRWRKSLGEKRSLGWIPLKQENLSIYLDGVRVSGKGSQPAEMNTEMQISEMPINGPNPIALKVAKRGPRKGVKTSRKSRKRAKTAQRKLALTQQTLALGWQKEHPGHSLKAKKLDTGITILGQTLRVFNEKNLRYYLQKLNAVVKGGSLAEDSLGDWYLNLSVEINRQTYETVHLHQKLHYPEIAPVEMVGIDPGIKSIAALSTGETIEPWGVYAKAQEKLASLQSNGRKRQAKRLHRKIKRQREDATQKLTTGLAKTFQVIKFGKLKVSQLVKRKHKKPDLSASSTGEKTLSKKLKQPRRPRMGKALLDNNIGEIKRLLSYKCHWAGRRFSEVCENHTTQVCSNCDHFTGPKGLRQLGVRTWICSHCDVKHDRDTNAAMNMERIDEGSTLIQSVPRCRHLYTEMKALQKLTNAGLLQTHEIQTKECRSTNRDKAIVR